MKKSLIGLFLLILLSNIPANANIQDIWSIPKDIQIKTLSSKTSAGIKSDEITYISGEYKGKPVKIFGYFCSPVKNISAGMPGVVLVHGGAGHADLDRAIAWAQRGYAALSIDLPGKGESRAVSRSTGPDMYVSVLLKVTPEVSSNYLYHAVRAARCGITFLEQQKIVNQGIAMVGLSWGGVITLLSNGTDTRLSAAVPVFGSGFLDEGSTWQEWFDKRLSKSNLKTYIDNFDARQYLKTQHAPLYYVTGTNDHCFYLPNFIRSYGLIDSSECTLSLFPNVKHKVNGSMMSNIYRYVDYRLKGKKGFPTINLETVYQKDNDIWFKILSSGPDPIKSVRLFYSISGVDKWTTKIWEFKQAKQADNAYYISLPRAILTPEIVFYASTKDSLGKQTSTPVYSLFNLVVNDKKAVIIKTEPVTKIFERALSKQTWIDIFGKNPPTDAKIVPFGLLWKLGAKLSKDQTAYYLKFNN